ncbi:MAG TPA: hypothetical protein VFQ60_00980 [Patescibacteria group bacterium]|nr:hypothetical protein [Patescibacteria group bacterium]
MKKSDVIGWLGSVFVLGAYALLNFGVLSSHSAWYFLLNIAGSLAIVIVSLRHKDYPPAFLNTAWIAITIGSILITLFLKSNIGK